MPDWAAPVDIYCERTDPSFWAEPVNALTNAAFLFAAAAALWRWRAVGGRDLPVLLLIAVTFAVGLGSFAFHTLATRGASLLDVIPIAVFIYGYLYLALRRFLALPAGLALAILAAFALGSFGLDAVLPARFLNGSGSYLPALGAMAVIGALARQTQAGRVVLAAAGLFVVSITFRSADQAICAAFPLGTHFLWHGLNAAVLYLLLHAAIVARPQTEIRART